MSEFNKLEKLLDYVVNNTEVYKDEYTLSFTKNNEKIQFIFSKNADTGICFLDCVKDYNYDDKKNKFEFDFPSEYIHNFLSKYLNHEGHYLLKYNKEKNLELEDIYNNLLVKINTDTNFSKFFLPGILMQELSQNDNKNKKQPKL